MRSGIESVTGGEVRGRYSIIGMKPDLVWKCHGKKSYINRSARFDDEALKNRMCPLWMLLRFTRKATSTCLTGFRRRCRLLDITATT